MFARKLQVRYSLGAQETPVPLAWLDSFAMRNFTNHALFDDLLPLGDGLLEAGFRVPLRELEVAMSAWLRRKGWLTGQDVLSIVESSAAMSAKPEDPFAS